MPNARVDIDVFPIDREGARASAAALCELLRDDEQLAIRITTNRGEVHWLVEVDGEIKGQKWRWSERFDPIDQIPLRIAAHCLRALRSQPTGHSCLIERTKRSA